jgi:hypothetical protein
LGSLVSASREASCATSSIFTARRSLPRLMRVRRIAQLVEVASMPKMIEPPKISCCCQ